VELVLAIGVLAVLLTFAIPNVIEAVRNHRLNSAVKTVVSYAEYAKQQALVDKTDVILCAYDPSNPDNCLEADDWNNGLSLIKAKVSIHTGLPKPQPPTPVMPVTAPQAPGSGGLKANPSQSRYKGITVATAHRLKYTYKQSFSMNRPVNIEIKDCVVPKVEQALSSGRMTKINDNPIPAYVDGDSVVHQAMQVKTPFENLYNEMRKQLNLSGSKYKPRDVGLVSGGRLYPKYADILQLASYQQLDNALAKAFADYKKDVATLRANKAVYESITSECMGAKGLSSKVANALRHAKTGNTSQVGVSQSVSGLTLRYHQTSSEEKFIVHPRELNTEGESTLHKELIKQTETVGVIKNDNNRSNYFMEKKKINGVIKNLTGTGANIDDYTEQLTVDEFEEYAAIKSNIHINTNYREQEQQQYEIDLAEYEKAKAQYDIDIAKYEKELAKYNKDLDEYNKQPKPGLVVKDPQTILVANKLPKSIEIKPSSNWLIYDNNLSIKNYDKSKNELVQLRTSSITISDKRGEQYGKKVCINSVGLIKTIKATEICSF